VMLAWLSRVAGSSRPVIKTRWASGLASMAADHLGQGLLLGMGNPLLGLCTTILCLDVFFRVVIGT
jgi:hypothetical protein